MFIHVVLRADILTREGVQSTYSLYRHICLGGEKRMIVQGSSL